MILGLKKQLNIRFTSCIICMLLSKNKLVVFVLFSYKRIFPSVLRKMKLS
jgi:hypothetical protein